MKEVTQSEAELAMKCYRTFLFAMKAVGTGLDRELSSDEKMKIWAVVKEVAEGKQTPHVNPAELIASPQSAMARAMKAHLQQTHQDTMRTEKELAQMLLDAIDGFVVR